MTSFSILDIKEFMNILLRTDAFDSFLLVEGAVTTCMEFLLDGHANAGFFSPEDEAYELAAKEDFVPFSLARPACFALIKGKRAPSRFHFVFRLSEENKRRTVASIGGSFSAEDISSLCLILRYQNRKLTCTAGVSYRIFSTDRSFEQDWGRLAMRFFHKLQIAVEPLS